MLRCLMLALLLSASLAQAQEEIAEQELGTGGAQLALSVYLDESGRALIIGYAEELRLSDLLFLTRSKYRFNNETSELYALTSALTSKQDDAWSLNFSIDGLYSDFSVTFYFPQSAAISKVTVSDGINYYVSAGSESLELVAQGFSVAAPEILVSYKQSLEVQRKEPDYLAAIVILFVLAIVILAKVYSRGKEAAEEEVAIPQTEKKEILVTSEMKKVMETLSENERRIVETLIRDGGKATQAKVRRETSIAKSSLSGHLNALDRKKIIKKREYGRTNIIELSPWFLGEKEAG